MWIGVTTHKNPLGQLCLISTVALLWCIYEHGKKSSWTRVNPVLWLNLLLTAYLLNAGGVFRSSTSIAGLLVAVSVFVVFERFKGDYRSVSSAITRGIVCFLVVAVVLQLLGTSVQAVVAALQGKDAHLTGRTWLWADVYRLSMRHLWLGAGYGGFWVESIYGQLSPEVDNRPAQSHNGYLETLANLGLVGLVLLLVIAYRALKTSTQEMKWDFDHARLRLCLLFSLLVVNYAEATFPRGGHILWFAFLMVAMNGTPAGGFSSRRSRRPLSQARVEPVRAPELSTAFGIRHAAVGPEL